MTFDGSHYQTLIPNQGSSVSEGPSAAFSFQGVLTGGGEAQVWAKALRPTALTPVPFLLPGAPRGKLPHARVWRMGDSRVESLSPGSSGTESSKRCVQEGWLRTQIAAGPKKGFVSKPHASGSPESPPQAATSSLRQSCRTKARLLPLHKDQNSLSLQPDSSAQREP